MAKETTIFDLMADITKQAQELHRIASMPLSEWVEEQKQKVDVDSNTGRLSNFHADNCSGCAKCEE